VPGFLSIIYPYRPRQPAAESGPSRVGRIRFSARLPPTVRLFRHIHQDLMMVHDYNLLVSYERRYFHASRQEILRLLVEFGDPHPIVRRTIARGLMGVRTALRNTGVIGSLFTRFSQDAMSIRFTLKWTPIDLWCDATLESMKQSLAILKAEIKPGERWMMRVEKRRFTIYHRIDIIKELAELIDEKVDLKSPDKIVWVEIIGKQAGMKVLRPDEIFSLPKLRGY